ncbi:hypothetical protein MTO96_016454 [Rhipicephalus appendiculatus]
MPALLPSKAHPPGATLSRQPLLPLRLACELCTSEEECIVVHFSEGRSSIFHGSLEATAAPRLGQELTTEDGDAAVRRHRISKRRPITGYSYPLCVREKASM